MNSSPRPYLKVTPLAVDPARDQQHLLVLDVDAFDRADPLREVEHLGLGERLGRVPAPLALPDHRRVEALLDRRPDREGGCEVVAVDDEIRAVADADLVDLGEELVAGVAGEDVREPRLDADPDEREPAGLAPALGRGELRVAELHARLLVRPLRVRLGERHRHVEVGAAGVESGLEDRRVEARVDRVQDRVGALGARERRDRGWRRTRRPRRRRSVSRPCGRRLPAPVLASTSARTIRSKKSRRAATEAAAAPTPPAPITRTRTSANLPAIGFAQWQGCGPRTSTSSPGSVTPGCGLAATRSRTSSGRSTARRTSTASRSGSRRRTVPGRRAG